MEFGIIDKRDKEITMDEWHSYVDSVSFLEVMEGREGINPFTGEKVIFHREHAAYYIEMESKVGNISLEQGSLLTTGVPIEICNQIASHFSAKVSVDDRS